MPTTKPRLMITFNDEKLYELVTEYRFENRFKSQNDAIMDLIDKGIEVICNRSHNQPIERLSEDDRRVIKAYHKAGVDARYFALQMLENNPAGKKRHA